MTCYGDGVNTILGTKDYEGQDNYEMHNFVESLIQCGAAVLQGTKYLLVQSDEYYKHPDDYDTNTRTVFHVEGSSEGPHYMIDWSYDHNHGYYIPKPVVVEAQQTTKWVAVKV